MLRCEVVVEVLTPSQAHQESDASHVQPEFDKMRCGRSPNQGPTFAASWLSNFPLLDSGAISTGGRTAGGCVGAGFNDNACCKKYFMRSVAEGFSHLSVRSLSS